MLKTNVLYKGPKPDPSELLVLFPVLDIVLLPLRPTHDKLVTVTDPIYLIQTLDWTWFRSLFQGEADVRALVLEEGDLRGVGISKHWGFYSLDTDGTHDFYMTNLRRLDPRAKANGFKTNFAWMFVHEYLHGSVWEDTKNRETAASLVHQWEAQGVLKAKLQEHLNRFAALSAQVQEATSLLAKLIAMFQRPTTPFHPVQWKPRIISQGYGGVNSLYPRTGRHIGTDYAIPIGTPLHAPMDGEVTSAGTSRSLGNFCHFTYKLGDRLIEERWCHLKAVPRLGKYGRASVVAYSGNTGQSTGPHLHREAWHNDVRIDLINKNNWAQLTFDPETLTA